jgi:PHD/YefM family antitoxin component YafN of YafNO toxin-antitoxin module
MTTVTTREFVQHFKNYRTSKEPVIIKHRNKPQGIYLNWEEWEKQQAQKIPKRLTLEELKKYTAPGGGDIRADIKNRYKYDYY